MPSLLKSPDGRVVTVSSSAHLFAPKVDWDDLNAEAPGAYGPWTSYGLSKLSNILFTTALQKRVDEKGGEPACCREQRGRVDAPTTPIPLYSQESLRRWPPHGLEFESAA